MSGNDKRQSPNETTLSDANGVVRSGDMVLRPAGPWTASIHSLLKYLREAGFTEAPAVAGTGFHADGRETVGYIEGEFVHPGPWSDEGIMGVGRMLRRLHRATASFEPEPEAVWKPWFLREVGGPGRIIGHGDVAPWNMVTRGGLPVALIDWEYAGPVDPLSELARTCWLFPQLHDDEVAERVGLPPLAVRARQLRLLVDAYEATADLRRMLTDRIVEVAVREAAQEAIDANVRPDSEGPLWGIAWRVRAAAWMLRNRAALERALA